MDNFEKCPDCDVDLGDPIDSTFSNIQTEKAEIGQHTGDIYFCQICKKHWIFDILIGKIRPWTY